MSSLISQLVVGLQDLNTLWQEWSTGREKRKQHSLNYRPTPNQNSSFSIHQTNVKASSTSSLFDISKSSNRRVLTIISYEAVNRGPVSLLGLFVWPTLFVCPGEDVDLIFEGLVNLMAAPSCIRAALSASCGLKAMRRIIWANSCSREKHIMP